MTERSRPPGLDRIAKDGVTLGARLALGLLAAPLLGLSLLARRTGQAGREQGQAAPVAGEHASSPVEFAASEEQDPPVGEGPARAEIEDALKRLTDATIPKRSPATGRAPKPKRPKTKTTETLPSDDSRKIGRRTKTRANPPRPALT